jgi:hypothetical protein
VRRDLSEDSLKADHAWGRGQPDLTSLNLST